MNNKTKENPIIALLGQPNSGKSTLFNGLTGLHQHVGNWPGKTVELKDGYFIHGNRRYTVMDLPGTYSLSANSQEEIITRDYIASGKADMVCILVDSSQIERSMFMLADFAGIKIPVILILNMIDIAMEQDRKINYKLLEEKLEIPVIPFSATDIKKYDILYDRMEQALEEKPILKAQSLFNRYREIENFSLLEGILDKQEMNNYSPAWLASKILEKDHIVYENLMDVCDKKTKEIIKNNSRIKDGALLTGDAKFNWIDELLKDVVTKGKKDKTISGFDRIATGKRWGKPIAILVILLGLLASFIPSAPFMIIGSLIPKFITPLFFSFMTSIGIPAFLISLVCDVILTAIFFSISMIGFVFGITLVFGFIEELGYMARISYVFDNTMSKLGLQGKAIMPFLVSFGCTIGGAAGSRIIDNWGQKTLTIALAWAIPCAATWAIVPLISSVFFGIWAPLVIIGIFTTALLHMFITSKIFRSRLLDNEDRSGLIMELPPYHRPKWTSLLRYVFGRTRDILFRALRVILLVSFIFWLLSYSPRGIINDSIIYKIGTAIEPVTKIFGLGWQTFMAFISSAISKEAALGVLSTLYLGSGSIFASTVGGNLATNIREILIGNITPPEALAFIFAVTFNIPCIVAVASTYQETHSGKWTFIISVYYIASALLLSFMIYHLALVIL